jgi:hypothetical protein
MVTTTSRRMITLVKTYEAYDSKIHVLELDSIPETGDETFSVGSHPIIVWNSSIDIQKHLVSEWAPHTPTNRGAIGVLGTKTVLVDVEYNEESRGLTMRELAQFMLNVLGCKTACVTPWEPIIVYTSYQEEESTSTAVYESDNRFPLPLTVDVLDTSTILPGAEGVIVVEAPKTKRKKKGEVNAKEE